MPFAQLNLIEPLVRAVSNEGYTRPTPIQERAIPHVLAGRDLLGIAQTGTGKTAAFVLPILQQLAQRPRKRGGGARVLVLAPTRELAAQIGESFGTYGRHAPASTVVIFGGVGQEPQVQALRRGVEVIVATPGRLLDLIQQKHCSLASVEIFVLDEADRMLDMGFIHDVRRIVERLPTARQTLFFSATMPDEVTALSRSLLRDPVRVEVTPAATTVDKIEQSVYFVEKADKRRLLERLLDDPAMARVLVFTRTKHGADRVARDLERAGVGVQALHGNKGQRARERALAGFKDGSIRVLVATDIAARGIDVDEISHVVNFDLPNISESYVHRIGRTARAGAAGIAISFCDSEERAFLRDIEKLIRRSVPVMKDHAYASGAGPRPPAPVQAPVHHRPPRREATVTSIAPAPAAKTAQGPRPGGGNRRRSRSFGSLRR